MPTKEELERDLAQARRDIEALTALAAGHASPHDGGLARGLEAALSGLSEEARASFEAARAEGLAARAALGQQVRDHPLVAAGIAFALGVLVTSLISRR